MGAARSRAGAAVQLSFDRPGRADSVPYFHPGNRVRIVSGTLAGLEGVILRQNGQARFVLSIDLILRSVVVNVDACDPELVVPAQENQEVQSPAA